MPYFFDPDYDVIIECLHTCKEQKAKYPPIKYGDHINNMYQATFSGNKEKKSEIVI